MPIKRKLYRSGYLHICQKSADNGIMFYSTEDILVFLTVLSSKTVPNNVTIVTITFMFNHLHLGGFFRRIQDATRFMNGSTSVFAKLYNKHHNFKGQLFKKPFKSAPKLTDKKIKDSLFYIWNNPIEKKAVEKVEDYRWNFLKYLDSDNPYSEPIDSADVSDNLLSLIRKAKALHNAGKYLDYEFFDDRYRSLSPKERLQLIDYIIVTFLPNNKDILIDYFGSYQSIIMISNTVSGNEFDLSDDNDNEDYGHYRKMISITRDEGIDLNHTRFSRQYFEDKRELLSRLKKRFRNEARATDYEIAKFLHLL